MFIIVQVHAPIILEKKANYIRALLVRIGAHGGEHSVSKLAMIFFQRLAIEMKGRARAPKRRKHVIRNFLANCVIKSVSPCWVLLRRFYRRRTGVSGDVEGGQYPIFRRPQILQEVGASNGQRWGTLQVFHLRKNSQQYLESRPERWRYVFGFGQRYRWRENSKNEAKWVKLS